MISRRELIVGTAAITGSLMTGIPSIESPGRIPDEGEMHACTWMAFAYSESIWGEDLLPGVQADLISVANTIADFEPVKMLVMARDLDRVLELVSAKVELVVADFDDLWIRDFGPQFMINSKGKLTGWDLKFNGWGKKQTHAKDRKMAAIIAKRLGMSLQTSKVTMEGGAVEVNGKGTLIATKSCIVNKNRNPGMTTEAIESNLKAQFGLKKVVWLPGIAGKDITDGHTDFYARFLPSGKVLVNLEMDPESFDYAVTRKHLEILRKEFGSSNVLTVSPPTVLPKEVDLDTFAAGYINYCLVNGGVIAPKFGDSKADAKAKEILEMAYPDRDVVMVLIKSIASGGGGIHCSTLHQPKAG